ncbi:MAG: glycerophosphodiester phosphodiesterase [Candidatus Omnitrophica bacterium]|nr:glycerophosphodiester phosphodiesterase [Candidatus Omnitrophota bacterium]
MFTHKPLVIGHRGAAALVPENTMPSFYLALETFKADMVEFDIHLTKDGIPVVIHDVKLDRTTNGKGYVSNYRFEEIRKLDAGFYFDPDGSQSFPQRGKGCHIPTLEEIFSTFPGRFLAIEVKIRSAEATDKVMELVKKYNAFECCIVGSKHDVVSNTMKTKYPQTRRFTSQKEVCKLLLDFQMKAGIKKDPQAVASIPVKSMGIVLDSKKWMDFLHEREMRVFYWTINEPAAIKQLAEKGTDGIISDHPEKLNQVLGRPI